MPSASTPESTGTLTTPSGLLAFANIRKGPNGKWSSEPTTLPASRSPKQATLAASRTPRPRLVITWSEGSVGSVAEIDGPERPPRGPVAPALIGAMVLALIVAGVVAVLVLRTSDADPTGLAPVTPSPFAAGDVVEPGPARAWFSADGTKLAVISAGAAGLSMDGTVRLLTDRGGNVVDLAWFSAGTALLVAEGPTPTGGLVVLQTNGEVRGTIPLEPPITFGTGHGMSVAPGGRRAVVTAVERDPFGVESTHLVEVDLTTGETRRIDTGEASARHPHHVDGERIAFTRTTDDGPVAVVARLDGTGAVELGRGEVRGVIGAGDHVAIQDGGRLLAVPPEGGEAATVGRDIAGRVVAVHPSGASAVVAAREGDAAVLRQISLVRAGST